MKSYNNAKIYKLICDEYFYFGHTCLPLSTRLKNHKTKSVIKEDMLLYKHIRDNGGWENVRIILIKDDLNVTNMEQLLQKEDEYIFEQLNNNFCLNSCRSYRTREQYYQDNKDTIIEKVKNRRDNNREEINKKYNENYHNKYKYRKEEYIECDNCGKMITRNNMKKHKLTKRCLNHAIDM